MNKMGLLHLLHREVDFSVELFSVEAVVLKSLQMDEHILRHLPEIQLFYRLFLFLANWTPPHIVTSQLFWLNV